MENKELNVILAGSGDRFDDFKAGLDTTRVAAIYQRNAGYDILAMLQSEKVEIVAVDNELSDMSGLDLVNRIAERHPFVNTALVSDSTKEDFHEETEGLGVLTQISNPPDKASAEDLLAQYAKIWGYQSGN